MTRRTFDGAVALWRIVLPLAFFAVYCLARAFCSGPPQR